MIQKFEEPIYVTRPLLPNLHNINDRINKVWESKWLTNNGEQHQELVEELKKYLEIENMNLFSNGTLALLLGLKAMDLKGEVITTPFTFPATLQALDWNGLTPVFCDIEKNTLNIDVEKLEALITEKTTAILGVHVFGNPCDVLKIQSIANKYKLKVIYDGAHAFGTKVFGKPIGEFGDMTMFSFHATKLFHTLEGGSLAFNDEVLTNKLDLLKNFGLSSPDKVVLSGINAKMNELQAGVGLEVLKLVDSEKEKRRKIQYCYEKGLANIPGIRIITSSKNKTNSYQYFVIEIDESLYGVSRDSLQKELQGYNVFSRRYFTPLCSDFSWYHHLESAKPQNLVQAHKSVTQVLSLPYYGELEFESVEVICEIIKKIHKSQV